MRRRQLLVPSNHAIPIRAGKKLTSDNEREYASCAQNLKERPRRQKPRTTPWFYENVHVFEYRKGAPYLTTCI